MSLTVYLWGKWLLRRRSNSEEDTNKGKHSLINQALICMQLLDLELQLESNPNMWLRGDGRLKPGETHRFSCSFTQWEGFCWDQKLLIKPRLGLELQPLIMWKTAMQPPCNWNARFHSQVIAIQRAVEFSTCNRAAPPNNLNHKSHICTCCSPWGLSLTLSWK